ncbi:hypothetical protein MFRU_024g00860 [Monilinia fructicola]|uniref:Cysteine-rich transmembrane CYSTM domain-containing protein n=1 Tax=Monilinia fructicola TaxID=38448 RepID=A0A5M9J8Z0_MONFR|nr:hypothetical protein EYC84_011744 [Monilinia fructicola]KAG4028116.1 hypothetical protein MFRU_024g00860 [Monilinia fructicola]
MAQQPQKPHRSLWDREPSDVANMPPVYTQEYDNRVSPQPQSQPQPANAVKDASETQKEAIYVQKQQNERKNNEDDVASGCCGCSVM